MKHFKYRDQCSFHSPQCHLPSKTQGVSHTLQEWEDKEATALDVPSALTGEVCKMLRGILKILRVSAKI